MFKKILVPLDGSELSEGVYPWVRTLVEKCGSDAEVSLIRAFELPGTVYLVPELAVPTGSLLDTDQLRKQVSNYLLAQSDKFKDCSVDTKVAVGEAASEILAAAVGQDLIVMASHGRGGLGKWLLGSVATKVLKGAEVPVLVVGARVLKDNLLHQGDVSKIVVPVDGSEPAERAFQLACDLARKLEASIEVYTSVSQVEIQHQFALETNRAGVEYYQEYQSKLVQGIEDISLSCTVKETYGRTGIASFAEEAGADLIVMGSHGRSGLERWLLGSQTEKTLHVAKCPVLVSH